MSAGVGKLIVCTALTVNERVTGGAAAYETPPTVVAAAFAVTVQVPNVSMVTTPAEVTVHTDVVDEVYVTVPPTLDVAARLNDAPPSSLSAGVANVIVWPVGVGVAVGILVGVAVGNGVFDGVRVTASVFVGNGVSVGSAVYVGPPGVFVITALPMSTGAHDGEEPHPGVYPGVPPPIPKSIAILLER